MNQAFVPVAFRCNSPDNIFDDEVIAVVGSCGPLGNWKVSESVILSPPKKADSEYSECCWSSIVNLPLGVHFFRFFIGRIYEDGITRHVVVRKIESVANYEIDVKGFETGMKTDVYQFAKSVKETGIKRFSDDVPQQLDGWITTQYEIQFLVKNQSVTLWDTEPSDCSIKFIPTMHKKHLVNEAGEGQSSLSSIHNFVTVAELGRGPKSSLLQPKFGCVLSDGYSLVFNMSTFDTHSLAYQIDLYSVPPHPGDDSVLLGHAYILPLGSFEKSPSSISVPLIDKDFKNIGHITLEYLIITPLNPDLHVFKSSPIDNWPQNLRTNVQQIGHRGLGSTYNGENSLPVIENTIQSFIQAAHHGAEFVEMDVQLTKNEIPVVYHDLTVCISSSLKSQPSGDGIELMEIPVKDLTLDQLETYKLYHVNKKELHTMNNLTKPFPTLKAVFQEVNPNIGFNIEIKWSMQMEHQGYKVDGFFSMNEYVDTMLSTIFKHADKRSIILSCFDPNVCMMLRRKQARYPVMFLTSCLPHGKSDDAYADIRTTCLPYAASLATSYNLMGLVIDTSAIKDDLDKIKDLRKNMCIFVFGSENNDAEMIDNLIMSRVDGIIHDRMNELNTKTRIKDRCT